MLHSFELAHLSHELVGVVEQLDVTAFNLALLKRAFCRLSHFFALELDEGGSRSLSVEFLNVDVVLGEFADFTEETLDNVGCDLVWQTSHDKTSVLVVFVDKSEKFDV